jgi:hypothetical protein
MFSKPIEVWDAQITSVHLKTEDSKVQTRIMVTGSLDADLAEDLGARHVLFSDNGTPKQGYSKLQLDTRCQSFRAVFEADPALKQSFEILAGDSTDRYIVERQADGVLQLKLRLNYHGDPHHALAYIMAVGDSQSILKIVPLQQELDGEKREDDEDEDTDEDEDDDEEPEEEPVQQELVKPEPARQRLITGRRHAKKQATGRI